MRDKVPLRGIKGTNCITTREVVRETVGEARYAAFVAGLPDDLRQLYTRRIMAVEWVDFDQWLRIEELTFERLFGRDEMAYRALSRRVTAREFSGVYRVLIKIGSPAYIVERAAKAYKALFTVGEMSCVYQSPRPTKSDPTIVRLAGVPNSPGFIVGMHGGLEGVLQVTRAHDPEVWIARREGSGDDYAIDFHMTY